MSKFKVGDKIRVLRNMTINRGKDELIGNEYTIVSEQGVDAMQGTRYGIGKHFIVFDSEIELVTDRHSIHITCTDGKTTHAVKKVDGKIVARSKAVCCPADEFNANIGARLAFNRLVYGTDYHPSEVALKPEQPKQEDKPKFKVGDRVRVINNTCGHLAKIGDVITLKDNRVEVARSAWHFNEKVGYITECDFEPYTEPESTEPKQEPVKLYCFKSYRPGEWFTEGKIYEVDKRDLFTADSGYHPSGREWRDNCRLGTGTRWSDYLVPLMSRPAKVGESALLQKDDCVGINKAGDVVEFTARGWIKDPTGKFHAGIAVTHGHEYKYVLDGYKPEHEKAEPEYYSGKVVCVKATDRGVTLGRVYTVEKGVFTWNNGEKSNTKATTIEQFNNWFAGAKFIEFKGE